MDNENWYRQLLALTLLSLTRAMAEWITNPNSRADANKQLRESLASIDYDAAAKAITRAIENVADTSKEALNETIDTLRDRGVDAVDEAKSRAEKQLGRKKSRKGLIFFLLLVGGVAAYFILDEQRRDDLLDRLTGASGPIDQAATSVYQQAASTAQQAANQAPDGVKESAQAAANEVKKGADEAAANT
jgi:hypothetical protein